ncbi:MAG: hypothetical protein BGO98_35445 [Myxococcales bacterium 68-20]|nr:MAG: hypothetical protein BGO98_35445 [Myxococcales bacterium 68-20]
MTHRNDPPRFEEEGPEALRALMRAMHQRGPSDAAAERIAKRLATAGVPTAPVKDAPLAGHWAASHKLALAALAALGVITLGWQATHASPPASPASPSDAFEAVPSSVASPTTAASAPVAPANVAPIEPAVVAIGDLPSASPPAARPAGAALSAGGVKAKTSTGNGGGAASPTELEIMQRAQSALAADPARALAITNEHARAYPSGELVQERELIAIEALARTGRKDQAEARAHALIQRFPRTPYAARLELAIGRPLPSLGAPRNP